MGSGIYGIGCDIVHIARFVTKLEDSPRLRERLFTPAERELAPERIAARFAAKESLIKALGDSHDLSWQDIEILPSNGARPVFTQTPRLCAVLAALNVGKLHLSISHDTDNAIAYVVAEEA